MDKRANSDFFVLMDAMRVLKDVPDSPQNFLNLYTKRGEKYVSRVVKQAVDMGLVSSNPDYKHSHYRLTPAGLNMLSEFDAFVKKYGLNDFLVFKYNGKKGF